MEGRKYKLGQAFSAAWVSIDMAAKFNLVLQGKLLRISRMEWGKERMEMCGCITAFSTTRLICNPFFSFSFLTQNERSVGGIVLSVLKKKFVIFSNIGYCNESAGHSSQQRDGMCPHGVRRSILCRPIWQNTTPHLYVLCCVSMHAQ